MALILHHSLTKACMSDIIQLLNYLVPECLPRSKYLFSKLFSHSSDELSKHFYCPKCSTYIGLYQKIMRCASCDEDVDGDDCVVKKKYFLVSPLEKQLRNLLETTEVYQFIKRGKTAGLAAKNGIIGDINTGSLYRCPCI